MNNSIAEFLNSALPDLDSLKSLECVKESILASRCNLTNAQLVERSNVEMESKQMIVEANQFLDQIRAFRGTLCDHMDLMEIKLNDFKSVQQVSEMTLLYSYGIVVQELLSLDRQLQQLFGSQAALDEKLKTFALMKKLRYELVSTRCANLVDFAAALTSHWWTGVETEVSADIDKIFEVLPWPLTSVNLASRDNHPTVDSSSKLSLLIRRLQQIAETDEYNIGDQTKMRKVVSILLKPFVKRFKYSFQGNRPTNNLSKPEFYLTQVLNWLWGHIEFLEQKIEPHLAESISYSLSLEFTNGLVLLIYEKVSLQLPTAYENDVIFMHFIDELLQFNNELGTILKIQSSLMNPNPLAILCKKEFLEHWLRLERQQAHARVEEILKLSEAWKASELNPNKTPQVVELFFDLLLGVVERFRTLPCRQSQIKFLNLVFDLLEDFRMRWQQLLQQECSGDMLTDRYYSMINGVWWIVHTLEDWSNWPLFVQLYCEGQKVTKDARSRSGIRDDVGDEVDTDTAMAGGVDGIIDSLQFGLFDDMQQLYQHMHHDMLQTCLRVALTDVREHSEAFCSEKRFYQLSHIAPSVDANSLPGQRQLSASACELLNTVKNWLFVTEQRLCGESFERFWHGFAAKLDAWIVESVVLSNQFSADGAMQFDWEMRHHLLALFGAYTRRPDRYLPGIAQSCSLLLLQLGCAMLLLEELLRIKRLHDDDLLKPQALANIKREFHLHTLTPHQVLRILRNRTDMLLVGSS